MTPDYAYSTVDLRDHNFTFASMSEAEIMQRKSEWEQHLAAKAAEAADKPAANPTSGTAPKPVFRPAKPKL